MHPELLERLRAAFASEVASPPAVTLRAGDAIDSGSAPTPFDPFKDRVIDEYIARYASGLHYLNASSWRHYLPAVAEYAIRHRSTNSTAVGAFINSLRPPDREPPRLASLGPAQEAAIREALEVLAFTPESLWQDEACQALEEWWVKPAQYRRSD